jgi:hypothetical protein
VADTYRTSDIEALVDDIGEAGAGLTAVPWNAAWDAEVQTSAAAALTAYDPPTKAELDLADDAVLAAIAALNDIDSTAAQAAAAAALAAYDAATATDVTNATSALATSAALATVDSNVDAILLDTGTDGVLVSTTGLTAIAAAVWDALTSGLTTVGSIGAYILNYLDAKVSTVGGGTTEGIAAAVWDYLTSAATTAGSLGALIVTKLGYLTSGTTVTVSSPVASGLNVTTIQGDDYKAADGRAIEWTVASTATLTGGTVAVIVEGVDTYVGSVVDETTIRLELTAAQTAAIPVGPRRYQVIHTQSVALGEDVTTLVDGTWTSARRYTE